MTQLVYFAFSLFKSKEIPIIQKVRLTMLHVGLDRVTTNNVLNLVRICKQNIRKKLYKDALDYLSSIRRIKRRCLIPNHLINLL